MAHPPPPSHHRAAWRRPTSGSVPRTQSGAHPAAPRMRKSVAHLRLQVPIRKLGPVLRPAHVGIRQDDSQRKRTLVVCDPDLEIHCFGASRDVMRRLSQHVRPLDVRDRLQAALEFSREARGEQRSERQPHLQVAHKIDNGIVDGARLIGLCVDAGLAVPNRHLRAVKRHGLPAPVRARFFDTQTVGSLQRDLPSLQELDLLSALLHDIVAAVHLRAER